MPTLADLNALINAPSNMLPINLGGNTIAQELAARIAAENALSGRAGTGLGLLDFLRMQSNDFAAREADPFRFVEYLSGVAGLPNQSMPINSLIGNNFRIQPTLPSPYADPRYQNLLTQLFNFTGNLTPFQNEDPNLARVRAAYGENPAAANTFFSQNPENLQRMFGTQQMARGGNMTLREPVAGVRLTDLMRARMPMKPLFIAGEAGEERLTFTPKKKGKKKQSSLGGMPMFQDGGTATIAPYEGALMSLATAFERNPFASPRLVQRLRQGQSPLAGDLTDRFVSNADPNLLKALFSGIQGQVGSGGLQSLLHAAQRFNFGSTSPSSMVSF